MLRNFISLAAITMYQFAQRERSGQLTDIAHLWLLEMNGQQSNVGSAIQALTYLLSK